MEYSGSLSNSVSINSLLLMFALAFILMPSMLEGCEKNCTNISLGFCVLLLLNTIFTANFRFSKYIIFMCLLFFAHWSFTPDNILQVCVFVTTMLLFEVIRMYEFSYKYILYPFLAFSAIGFIITLPDLLRVLTGANIGRADLYSGLYTNSNTTATMSNIVIMSALLFLKTPYVKNIFMICSLIGLFATGCRGGFINLCTCLLFYWLLKKIGQKTAFFAFLLFLIVAFLYMVFVEAQHLVDFKFMGKDSSSSGRALQIIYVIRHFSVNLFGYGKDVINNAVLANEQFVIHNLYVNSLYSEGLLILLAYFYYLYHFFTQITSLVAKAFLLSFHVAFFFEPGYCYYYSPSIVFVNVVLSLQLLEERKIEKLKDNELMLC